MSVLPWATIDEFIASLDSVPWYSNGATDPRWKVYETLKDARNAWDADWQPRWAYEPDLGSVILGRTYGGPAGWQNKERECVHKVLGMGHANAACYAVQIVMALWLGDQIDDALRQHALDEWSPWLAGYGLLGRGDGKFYVYKRDVA